MTPRTVSSGVPIVVFDLGGVLVDWDPRYLMDRVIDDPLRRKYFLTRVLSTAFFMGLDISKDSRAAIVPAIAQQPDYAKEIATYIERFPETMNGEFPAMTALVQRLHRAAVPLFGLTNWAGDTFDQARPHLPNLTLLRDIVVSGHEGIVKPDPRIFALLCRRGDFAPSDAVFVDDSLRNVEAARAFGMAGIHHRSAEQTIAELRDLGLPA